MCAVCVVFDYGRNLPVDFWTLPAYNRYVKLVEEAKMFDLETGQPDCHDPKKAEWIKEIQKTLQEQEQTK